jgi:hypothetical protein
LIFNFGVMLNKAQSEEFEALIKETEEKILKENE